MYIDLCTYIIVYTYILSDEVIATQNTYIPSAERYEFPAVFIFYCFGKKNYILSYTHRNHQHGQSWYMVYTVYMQYAHTENGTTGYT